MHLSSHRIYHDPVQLELDCDACAHQADDHHDEAVVFVKVSTSLCEDNQGHDMPSLMQITRLRSRKSLIHYRLLPRPTLRRFWNQNTGAGRHSYFWKTVCNSRMESWTVVQVSVVVAAAELALLAFIIRRVPIFSHSWTESVGL
jgi:hypothetical protein